MTGGEKTTFVLEFSFSADQSDLLPMTEAADTYLHVLGLTTIKPDLVKGMLPLWLHGYQNGDPRIQQAALGPLRSPDISFVWPWFTEWLDHFRAQKLLPRAWELFADQVKDRRLGLREERVPLLSDVLIRTMWNRREANQHAASVDTKINGHSRGYAYDLVADCEASESILKECLDQLVPGDWRTYPPYFPGDRTSVRQKGLWK